MNTGASLAELGDDGFLGGADLERAQVVERTEEIVVRGETIPVTSRVRVMPDGSEFQVAGEDPDPLALAYAEYRRRHGLPSGRDLAEWRGSLGKGAGLTQSELARVLGFGQVTLKRYETGSLPSEAHEKVLRLARNPAVLREMVVDAPADAMPAAKRDGLLAWLDRETAVPASVAIVNLFRAARPAADVFTGFRLFDLDRVREVVRRVTRTAVPKTKLNKLLFYCDFRMFREATLSITGIPYARLPFGPTPDDYAMLFGILAHEGSIATREVAYPNGASGEEIQAVGAPSEGVLGREEIRVIDGVVSDFARMTAIEISNYSHEEAAWKETANGRPISYEYAFALREMST